MRRKLIIGFILSLSNLPGWGQSVLDPPLPIPYPYVREADILWSKRIWRSIDLREKINHPLYYPTSEMLSRRSLFQVLRLGIITGELKAYDPNPAVFTADQEFSTPLAATAALQRLTYESTITVQDTGTGEINLITVIDTFRSEDVLQYWIKEDWFFDKQRSVLEVRILGIAPVVETKDEQGEFKGYKPLFWLYFPDCRKWLSGYRCYNPYNDAEWRTYEEVFRKRIFSSYIRQESNVYNRSIASYACGTEALLESERIKEMILNFENDLWSY